MRAGIGLRARHHLEVLANVPEIGWFEAHAENYMADGGAQVDALLQIRARYPLSLHGVGLSLGSTDPLDREHLAKLRRAVHRFEPMMVSEHLSWSSVGGQHVNDLLPLPYTAAAVRHVSARIAAVQDALSRQLLLENVSSYVQFECSEMPEWEFLNAVAAASGCGLLLDLNNIYVSAVNHGFDPRIYLEAVDASRVAEIHLAGHSRVLIDGHDLLIDTHGAPVCEEVWALYRAALRRYGDKPTLIEWDTDIPALEMLLREAAHADGLRGEHLALAA